MVKQSFKISSRLALLGLVIGALPQSAIAAGTPEIHFYPEAGWEIGAANSAVSSGAGCSIHNEFNNGFIITLSGSSDWVQQLDINFRQNVFTPSEVYDVFLSVPGVARQTFKARANSGDTLALSMKGQKEFYAAMRDSSVVDVTVQDNRFRFYMTGFSKSAVGFEQCLAGLKPTSGVRSASTEPAAVPPPAYNPPAAEQAAASVKDTVPAPMKKPADLQTPRPNEAVAAVAAAAKPAHVVKSVALPPPIVEAAEKPAPVPARVIPQEELVKPPSDFLLNESIAYEDAEVKGVPITEIVPEIPQPEIQGIPPQRANDIAAPTINSATAAADVYTSDNMEVSRRTPPLQKPEPRKKMTEKLAAQIAANPSLAWAADPDDPKKSYVGTMREPLELPPSLAKDPQDPQEAQDPEPLSAAPLQDTDKLEPASAREKALEQQSETRRVRVEPAPTAPSSNDVREIIARDVPENAGGNYNEELARIRAKLEEQRKQMEALEAQLSAE